MNKKVKASALGMISALSAGIIGVGTILALRTVDSVEEKRIAVATAKKTSDVVNRDSLDIKSTSKISKEIFNLKKEISKLKTELNKVLEDLRISDSARQALMKSFDKLLNESKNSKEQLGKIIIDLLKTNKEFKSKLENEKMHRKEDVDRLEKEVLKHKTKLNKTIEELGISNSARQALMKSFDKLLKENKQSKALYLKMVTKLIKQLNDMEVNTINNKHIIEDLKNQINQWVSSNEKLKEELNNIKLDRKMIKDELGKANEEKDQLKKDKKFLEKANQGLMDDVKKATDKINNLTRIGKLLDKFNELVLQRGEIYANLLVNKRNLGATGVHDTMRKFYEKKSKEFQNEYDKLTKKIKTIQDNINKLRKTTYSLEAIYNINY